MKFCENCNNALFLKIISPDEQDEDSNQPDKLYYTCKKCNYKKEHTSTEDSCFFQIDYNIDNISSLFTGIELKNLININNCLGHFDN